MSSRYTMLPLQDAITIQQEHLMRGQACQEPEGHAVEVRIRRYVEAKRLAESDPWISHCSV